MPLRGCLLIFFQKRQFILSSMCAANAGPRSHPISENQEVPVRINIAFYTSKELLMGGQRQEAEQKRVRLLSATLPFTSISSEPPPFPREEKVADIAQEQSEPQTGLALCLSKTQCPTKRQG